MNVIVKPNLASHPDAQLDEFLRNEGDFSEIEAFLRDPHGTETGKAVIIIRIKHPDGRVSYARTTQALYMGAGSAFKGAQEREDHIAEFGGEPPVPQCNVLLKALGIAYPRTCKLCGLGPCRNIQPAGS